MTSWKGLGYQECIDAFDSTDWRDQLEDALCEIAASKKTAHEDRIEAMNLLGVAMKMGILEYNPMYASLMRDVLLEELQRRGRAKSKKKMLKMHRRLAAAKALLGTAIPWFEHKSAAEASAERGEAAAKSNIPTDN
jgi:hypothetical protein